MLFLRVFPQPLRTETTWRLYWWTYAKTAGRFSSFGSSLPRVFRTALTPSCSARTTRFAAKPWLSGPGERCRVKATLIDTRVGVALLSAGRGVWRVYAKLNSPSDDRSRRSSCRGANASMALLTDLASGLRQRRISVGICYLLV